MCINETWHRLSRLLLALGVAVCLLGGGVTEAGENTAEANGTVAVQEVSPDSLDPAFLQSILGKWQEDVAKDARTLIVNADGSYVLVSREGSSQGTIKILQEEFIGGEKVTWYNFYKQDGTFWLGFPRDGEYPVQRDLFSGQDGAIHFVRQENGCHDTGSEVQAADYAGVWTCGRCWITITPKDRGYQVEMQWASNAAEGSRWSYFCTFDGYSAQLFCEGKGTRTDYVFEESGACKEKVVYQNGSGVFTMRRGIMFWSSPEEKDTEDMEFRQ